MSMWLLNDSNLNSRNGRRSPGTLSALGDGTSTDMMMKKVMTRIWRLYRSNIQTQEKKRVKTLKQYEASKCLLRYVKMCIMLNIWLDVTAIFGIIYTKIIFEKAIYFKSTAWILWLQYKIGTLYNKIKSYVTFALAQILDNFISNKCFV